MNYLKKISRKNNVVTVELSTGKFSLSQTTLKLLLEPHIIQERRFSLFIFNELPDGVSSIVKDEVCVIIVKFDNKVFQLEPHIYQKLIEACFNERLTGRFNLSFRDCPTCNRRMHT